LFYTFYAEKQDKQTGKNKTNKQANKQMTKASKQTK